MIEKIASLKRSNFWLIFHAFLGAASTFTPWVLILWIYACLFINFPGLVSKNRKQYVLNSLIVYLGSFELLARMAGTSPFIPYELGKYLLFIFFLYGILTLSDKGKSGLLLLLLLAPGIFLGLMESGVKTLVFNALGPINIALAIYYFYKQQINLNRFVALLRLLVYPLLAVLCYTLIKTPTFDEIEFSLGANFSTTGGFGSNQVSTAFGAAMFLLFLFVWNNWEFSRYRWLDITLLFLFAFQGLLSFSRGGMVGGGLAILIVLIIRSKEFYDRNRTLGSFKKMVVYAPLLVIILVCTFLIADNITGGMLSLRYAGETAGTLAGSKEKNLNTFTTNRANIFSEDLMVFENHAILGVGVGQSMEHRIQTKGQLPHVELSRLLSEHGILGIAYFIILLWKGWEIFKDRRQPGNNILLAFFILALYTTFHAATRTYFTPLFVGLSVVRLVVSRKVNGIDLIDRSEKKDNKEYPLHWQ